jgi:hypothetical protein
VSPSLAPEDAAREYYNRVSPVVGDELSRRHLAVWDLSFGYLAAEALARTGLRRQSWLDGGTAGGAFCRSLGQHHVGLPRGEALATHCAAHNTLERDWAFSTSARTPEELARILRSERRPDLLVARLDTDARAVAKAAIDEGIPFVGTFVPASAAVSCVQVVWLPGSAAKPEEILELCEGIARVAPLDLERAESHLDGLEARSLSLALARWILLRGRTARPDLEGPIVEEGRAVLLRGDETWPWTVRFARPRAATLLPLLASPRPRYQPPAALAERTRLLVLGLGTASLFCAEAVPLLARRALFVDCKEVSPVNPVRQIYGTSAVGVPKPDAIVRILAERIDPLADWSSTEEGPIRTLRGGGCSLGAARLRLDEEDPASIELFGRVLDAFEPTLTIVGMGRSKDDNFTATAELRRRGVRHVTPTAFPAVTHFKHILTDGAEGPCYDCLQGHLPVDGGSGPELDPLVRELYYGGTQPATLAETLPSSHSLLRLGADLSLPRAARPLYLLRELSEERACFVGSNRAERTAEGGWLYGVDRPFSMVTFGAEDLGLEEDGTRCLCGRIHGRRDKVAPG